MTHRITKVEKTAEGYWRARLTVDGTTYPVDRRDGSWKVTVQTADGPARRELLQPWPAKLQAALPTEERRGVRRG